MAETKQHDERSETGRKARTAASVRGLRQARLRGRARACRSRPGRRDARRRPRRLAVRPRSPCARLERVRRRRRSAEASRRSSRRKVEGDRGVDSASRSSIAADRRIEGLLAGARRGKLAIAGADVVRAAYREGTAAARRGRVGRGRSDEAPGDSRARSLKARRSRWSNKQRLGAIFGRDEVAVCAVLHEGVAKAIGSARRMALPFAEGARSEAWWSSEDSMSKVRVYEVAKQLNLDPKAVVGLFQSIGVTDVRNHMSPSTWTPSSA